MVSALLLAPCPSILLSPILPWANEHGGRGSPPGGRETLPPFVFLTDTPTLSESKQRGVAGRARGLSYLSCRICPAPVWQRGVRCTITSTFHQKVGLQRQRRQHQPSQRDQPYHCLPHLTSPWPTGPSLLFLSPPSPPSLFCSFPSLIFFF